jgi:transposase
MRPRGTKAELEARRRRAIRLLKQKISMRETARAVGASLSSVERWKAEYEAGGLAALPGKPDRGSASKLTVKQQAQLIALLRKGPTASGFASELWTLERVAQVIERQFKVHYCLAGVWLLLHRLGWSAQKPERAARERNEGEIERWRRVTWPKLRKRSRA